MKEPKTPELNKLTAISEKSNAIGDFVSVFLREKGVVLGQVHKHSEKCSGWLESQTKRRPEKWLDENCGVRDGEIIPFHYNMEKLLAEFYDIDLNRVEDERRAVLEALRKRK